ncbi:hypothetical protein QAD02_006469 [Eretmocerus hayati]|uniref:Uncharacterized protein n=1 Tax=Eretmocerus hayati TaxID=131215 RepID=A0ACC2N1B5_9HYME|nr:hypothetical protein QAD02_006469 [Eretmocerus hayati]
MRGYKHCFLLIYIIFLSMISIGIFLYGYFPFEYSDNSISSTKNIPTLIDSTRVRTDEIYKPVVKKMIIMVIDALRWDFVYGPLSNKYMPNTNHFLQKSMGCLYKTRVHSPTVTMPRIKAMMTGAVPNFIDVIFNLGANEVISDSILRQATNHGHRSIFYGDDVWLKLFPTSFFRHEGTNSFYVTDFTEVDNNVTKNVVIELEKDDWSIMVLHYLGLDHIGHVLGPFSSLIEPKLREMDNIINMILTYTLKQKKNGEETLFLVCGDHGMKDSGGHGGSTPEETLVPLIAFGISCTNLENSEKEIAQIDIAPTLSVLLGTPIPSSNLGSIIPNLMEGLSFTHQLFALHYNAKQLFSHYEILHNFQPNEVYETYQNAITLHSAWLSTKSNQDEMVHDIIVMYESAIIRMKHELSNNLLKYNIRLMSIAAIFMCQMLYLCTCAEKSPSTSSNKWFCIIFIMSYISWELLNKILDPGSGILLFSENSNPQVVLPVTALLLINSYICSTFRAPTQKVCRFFDASFILPAANFAHGLSLSSSSFVEEEHQTWYFYWITVMTFLVYDITKRNGGRFHKGVICLILLMICHRVLRKLNSTGNKYAHLPDISDWFLNQESHLRMTSLLISSLVILVAIDYHCDSSEQKLVVLVLDTILAVLVYLRHAVAKSVFFLNIFTLARSTLVIQLFWYTTLISVVYSSIQIKKRFQKSKGNIPSTLLYLAIKLWVITSCLLHRPYNIILLPIQLLAGAIIYKLTQVPEYYDLKIFLYLWSGSAFYFYQGNSNSLATVDVAAGFVGLESYRPTIIGVFLVINTYSAQVLSLLMYLYDNSSRSLLSSHHFSPLYKQYIFWRILPMTFYIIITSLQRHHLFVWTVFSPKLLYEAMHSFVIFTIILVLHTILEIYSWIERRIAIR